MDFGYRTNNDYHITFMYNRRKIKFASYLEEFEINFIESKIKDKLSKEE